VHTYTFTPDAAVATALLGNTMDAFNQVWHVPTTKERLTSLQWIELAAREARVTPAYQVAPLWLLRILGIFIPVMRELPEMMYQFESDYVFDSSKFEKRFGITATSPEEGIRILLKQHPFRKGHA
jgi:nucleoside-diphosphate-sugar epimerase